MTETNRRLRRIELMECKKQSDWLRIEPLRLSESAALGEES